MLYETPVASAASRPPYTAQSRWSHNDDESVTVVQSTHDYIQHIFNTKPQTARWVRGLAEDEGDDAPALVSRSRPRNTSKWEELDDTPDEVLQVTGRTWGRRVHWLLRINLLAIVYLCIIAVRIIQGIHGSYRMDYPNTLTQLEIYGRRYGESGVAFLLRVGLPLALPHAVGAAYTLSLAYTIGRAAQNFVALCGVGLSLLSVGALCTQCIFLFCCCDFSSSSHRWECELPLALHHVCSVIRVLCPLLAAWCVSPVLDELWGCGYRWRCVLALPCVCAVSCLGISLYNEIPSQMMLDLAHISVLLAWLPFVKSCWGQKRFATVVLTEKLHNE